MPSECKIRSWVLWDSVPRITVLAKAGSNLAVRRVQLRFSVVRSEKLVTEAEGSSGT
jgi:hypothetical protein